MSFVWTGAIAWQLACKRVRPFDCRARGQLCSAKSRLWTAGHRPVAQQRLLMQGVWITGKSLRRGTFDLVENRINVWLFYFWLVGQHVARIIRKRCARLNLLQ